MYFILFYETVENYVKKRQPYREKHLAMAQKAADDGLLILAGAYANPADGAALIFKSENINSVKQFAENDPYVTNGVIKKWYIKEWTVVIKK